MQFNTSLSLLKVKGFAFGTSGEDVTPKEAISIDCLLPRVMHLAENSVERQTKVTSCELLHALVTAAVGFHAQSGGDSGEKYLNLFKAMLPCVLRLAVDGDPVSTQLFVPIIYQMIHWYATKPEYGPVASELLDAILEGIESQDNGKLREKSAEFMEEYVRWTLKGITTKKDKEDATAVKRLLYRVYGLLNHPSATKRLGAYLAVRKLASIWKQNASNHTAIIDQFLLEVVHNCILSLRLCQNDERSMDTEMSAVDALDKLWVIVSKRPGGGEKTFADMFKESRKPTPRRTHEKLESFAKWVYEQVASHEKPSRRYCMDILPKISEFLNEIQPKKWIKDQNSSESRSFANRFEDRLLDSGRTLKLITEGLTRMETTLDVYWWLLDREYASPTELFPQDGSDLAPCVKRFLEKSEMSIESTFPTATRSEMRKYALQKSRCIYALLKLLCKVVSDGDANDPGILPELVSLEMMRMLVLSLVAPRKLGLNILSDPIVNFELPGMFQGLFKTLPNKPRLLEKFQTAFADIASGFPQVVLRDPEQTLEDVGR